MKCAEARLALGAYVLGALDPHERSAVELHVDGCSACRNELAELAALPGLLGRLTEAEVEAGPPSLDPRLLDRLLAEVRAQRRRARWRVAAVAAAAAAVAAGGTAAGLAATHTGGASGRSITVHSASVSAAFHLTPKKWGTAIRLDLTGVPAGTHCWLVAASRNGQRDVAGAWEATYRGSADVDLATAIPMAQLTDLQVVADGGQVIANAPLTHAD
jgi:anti-sigma-K factor RskA